MDGVNLIPVSRRNARRRRQRVHLWSSGCGTYASALVVLCIFLYIHGPPPKSAQAKALVEADDRVHQLGAAIDRERKGLAQVQALLEASKAVSDRPNWSTLLGLIAKTLDQDTVLDHCQLDPLAPAATAVSTPSPVMVRALAAPSEPAVVVPHQFQLDLGGMGRSEGAGMAFVLRLQEMGLFEQVNFVNTSRASNLAGEAITFQVRCTLQERPKR